MTNTILTVLGFAAVCALIVWSTLRLEVQHDTYRAYEECVEREYGTTPSAFYQEHGTNPECR